MALGAVAAAALLACTVSDRSSSEPRVFVVDDGVKVAADGRFLSLVDLGDYAASNPAWDGRAVTLAGARRETVAFQLMVAAGARPLRGADVAVSELRREGGGRIGPEHVALFREWYVPVTVKSTSPGGSAGLGEYPDALIPASTRGWGLPVDVAPGRTQGIWIDLAIPADARAGAYRGSLVVRGDGNVLARLDVRLDVHAFSLPVERHLRWRVGYSGWEAVPRHFGIAEESEEWLRMEADLYRLAWEEHRIVPTTHYHDLRLPIRGRPTALVIDWTGFDRRFGRYLDGTAFADGRPLPVFSLPVNLHRRWPTRLTGDRAGPDEELLEGVVRQVARHWEEKGWRLGDAFVYVADEPGSEGTDGIRRACDAIRRGDPRIRTSVAFHEDFGRDPSRNVEAYAGRVTMWDVAADHFDRAAQRSLQARGHSVGIYQGGEPYVGGEALDGDGLALTTWPWIAWRYGLDHLFLYNMTEWDYFRLARAKVAWKDGKREIWENPLNQSWATNSQGVLVYPGQYVGIRGVVPSIRLKQVRRGLQDYEYLWLASQAGRRDLADAVSRRLIPMALEDAGKRGNIGPPGSWQRNPMTWSAGRRELAASIAARGAP